MKTIKKLALIGCALAASFALIKWIIPRYAEVDMQFSEPLPDGYYNVEHGSNPDRIKIKNGRIYHIT